MAKIKCYAIRRDHHEEKDGPPVSRSFLFRDSTTFQISWFDKGEAEKLNSTYEISLFSSKELLENWMKMNRLSDSSHWSYHAVEIDISLDYRVPKPVPKAAPEPATDPALP